MFGDAKPTCANCAVHCYKANMRERVRAAMRWAGPRMLWRHPVLAIRHMIDGRLPAPALQRSRLQKRKAIEPAGNVLFGFLPHRYSLAMQGVWDLAVRIYFSLGRCAAGCIDPF